MSKGYMYILQCADDSYYTGSTKNLEQRLEQHHAGEGANYTKKHLPVKLIYFEEYKRIDEAFYREKQVQGWSRKKKEALINGSPELLPSLAIAYRDIRNSGFENPANGGFENLSHHEPMPEALRNPDAEALCNSDAEALCNSDAEALEATDSTTKSGFENPANGGFENLSHHEPMPEALRNPDAEALEATDSTTKGRDLIHKNNASN